MRPFEEESLVKNFRKALANGRIRAYFQPIYRSFTKKVFCAEALARWFFTEDTVLSPEVFVPVLEKNDLICELDLEILRQLCEAFQKLKQRGTPINAFSVNLSRYDFKNEGLFDQVTGILRQYDVPPEAVKLEITETLMIEDDETFKKLFQRFSEAGFSIWMDDFGSGFSSLNVLQRYQFDVIKFDMLFLNNLTLRGRELIAYLISTVKTLGIHTLIEGVESEEQREFMLMVGCEAQQGFYYSKPLSLEELIRLVDADPDLLEKKEDWNYWNQIGTLNFLNAHSLKEFSARLAGRADEKYIMDSFDNSIALLECSQQEFHYVYASPGYRQRVHELGFDSVGGLEAALSNQRSHHYLMLRKTILEAIQTGETKTIEYVNKDVYYRLNLQLLARKAGWVMLGVHLSTFDSEREVKTAQAMLNYSSALFSTYELVVLIFPERRAATRLYTSYDLPVYDKEPSLDESIVKFCQAEIYAADQERYMEFLNLKTLGERIEASENNSIQGFFRTRWNQNAGAEQGRWYTARVTNIPNPSERAFILTFQSIRGDFSDWVDLIIKEHPEFQPS